MAHLRALVMAFASAPLIYGGLMREKMIRFAIYDLPRLALVVAVLAFVGWGLAMGIT